MQMLNFSKKIYVGWSSKFLDLPDVEITPVGTAVNEKNKVKKLTNKYQETMEYENEELPGFTLLRSESKSWSTKEVEWLVIDPRGFVCRISTQNLNNILSITGITEGLIQEKCVWARYDNETKLSLIPVNSPGYAEAVQNTILIDNKVSKSEINYGDKVLLQNGMTGRYMGTESLYGGIDYSYSSKEYSCKVNAWCRRQIIETEKGHFYYATDLKILKVTEETKNPMTREECVKYMNDQLKNGAYFASRHDDDGKQFWSKPTTVRLISSAAISKPLLSFVEITKDEAEELYRFSCKDGDKFRLVVEDNVGKYVIDIPYTSGNKGTYRDTFIPEPIKGIDTTGTLLTMSRGRSAFNNYGSRTAKKLDNFAKFYKIVKHVKTDSYV